jgi:predicted ArsR family transcriptional regulator
MTGNAIRAHLAALERDGLVETREVRRGPGKPSRIYALTPSGEGVFPKAHGLVMGAMIEELRARLGPAEMARFLRDVALRLPAASAPPGSPLAARLEAAAAAFGGLGGVAQVEETATGYAIFCRDCPLGDVATGHDEACGIAQAVLSEVAKERLENRCARGSRPSCRFEVRLAKEARASNP